MIQLYLIAVYVLDQSKLSPGQLGLTPPTVRGPNLPGPFVYYMGSRQIGPTVGPTVHFMEADSWVLAADSIVQYRTVTCSIVQYCEVSCTNQVAVQHGFPHRVPLGSGGNSGQVWARVSNQNEG